MISKLKNKCSKLVSDKLIFTNYKLPSLDRWLI